MSSSGICGNEEDKKRVAEMEGEMKKNSEAGKPETNDEADIPKPKPALKIREHWGQEKGQIVLTMYQKKLTKEDVSVKCTDDTITVSLSLSSGYYTRNIQLAGRVDPQEFRWVVNPYKVQIFAKKAETKKQWKAFELTSDDEMEPKKESLLFNSWTKEKEKAVDEEYKIAKKEEEEADALDSLFKKIYRDADADTRRAMIKSYQTSGGTVLSTNWKEVKEKDYEGKDKVVPKGFEE